MQNSRLLFRPTSAHKKNTKNVPLASPGRFNRVTVTLNNHFDLFGGSLWGAREREGEEERERERACGYVKEYHWWRDPFFRFLPSPMPIHLMCFWINVDLAVFVILFVCCDVVDVFSYSSSSSSSYNIFWGNLLQFIKCFFSLHDIHVY